jgi:isopentenyl phosphate kinase
MTICFLKLGGSLITDKDKTDTPNLARLAKISEEISKALHDKPDLRLIIGHGSGSFGHHAAKIYHTRDGVKTMTDWRGFAEVWKKARMLNEIVVNSLSFAHIPVISFPPSSFIITSNHKIVTCSVEPIRFALENHLVPVVYGDVIFDREIGGTILSTEEIFTEISQSFVPDNLLIAGTEPGVWKDFKQKDTVLPLLTNAQFHGSQNMPSASVDVTGGMGSKVTLMFKIAQRQPKTEIYIFSGTESGNIYSSLIGNHLGTRISYQERG